MSDSQPSDWAPNFGGVSQNPPAWPAKRPVRIAILGDFGAGALNGRLDGGDSLARRKPLKVEFDTLDDALARIQLSLKLPLGADGAAVDIEISELEGFHPDELYRQVGVFSALAALRKKLNNTATFAAAAAEVNSWGTGGGRRASSIARHGEARGATPSIGAKLDDFARLTGCASSSAKADAGVAALLRNIVGPFVVAAPDPKKDALLATVDSALTDAMRAVLHQGDFQNTESLWRGVDFLLRRIETGPALQVHLFDISAEELAADLSRHDDLAQSALYQLLVATPAQDADGGYTYLAGCYHFEATPPHAELLGRAARVAAHAGAPFLTAITTDAFADRREPPHRLVRDAFAGLRAMPDASWLGLFGPRFLLRHPYGKRSDPIQSFAFEEFSRAAGLRGMLWGHPALLALTVLGTPGGQLAIKDLPFHHYIDEDGDSTALPCTDRLINTNIATLLRDVGINGVMAHKGEPLVRLSGLEAVNGDGLAATQSKPRPEASRVSIGSRQKDGDDDAKPAAAWSAPVRRAGAPGASADIPASVTETADSPAPDSTDSVDGGSGGGDDELASLLAGLDSGDGDSSASKAEGAEAEGGEPSELDALLASLNGGSDAPAADGAAEEDTDADLDALLKSLG